jgi:hypothetical protein
MKTEKWQETRQQHDNKSLTEKCRVDMHTQLGQKAESLPEKSQPLNCLFLKERR